MCASKPLPRKAGVRAGMRLWRWSAALLLATQCAPALASDLQVLRITPSGNDVAAAGQIVIHFDRAVVPLGRMERDAAEVPVKISPDPGCQWRWLDAQALACNPPPMQALQRATRYTVEVAPEFETVQGERLRKGLSHSFVTELPKMDFADVNEWRGAGLPVVRVRFNQAVTAAAVARSLQFGNVPAQAQPEYSDATTPFYTPEGEARRTWVVQPVRELRGDSDYELRLLPGLRSALGTEPSREAQKEASFHTFPAPRLVGIECQVDGRSRQLAAGERTQRCAPLEGVSLVFSAPVGAQALKSQLKLSPNPLPAQADPDYDPWAGIGEDRSPGRWHRAGRHYSVRLPFVLAADTDYRIELGTALQDLFGRPVERPQTLSFRTGARSPKLVFEHDHAVIESGVDSEVPVVVTNLDHLRARFERWTATGLQSAQQHEIALPPVRNLAVKTPLDVRGMVGGNSGAVRGHLQTAPQTDSRPREFFATVTPWQVHAKFGHTNLLVWVTSMADGLPVDAAEVAVLDQFGGSVKASARTDSQGVASLQGGAELDPKLERQWSSSDPGPLWVRVQRGSDIAVLPLSSAFVIDTWRASREQISAWRRERHGHLKSWGTTAQGVYRAGDRVQYKLYVRDDAGRSLAAAPSERYTLKVFDPTGTVVHERARQTLSAFGALDGEFALTERAAVGWYRFQLQPDFADDLTLEPLRVLVSDFVPAPFRVIAEQRAAQAGPGDSLPAVLGAKLHGGGPFADAKARLTASIESTSFSPDDALAARYQYDNTVSGGRHYASLPAQEGRLDSHGEWTQPLIIGNNDVLYGRLNIEASVQDDRGRNIAAQASVPYVARDRFIGLHYDGWLAQAGMPATVELLVVDAQGQPLAGEPYYVKIERKVTRGARVKGAGNAYITRYLREWQRVSTCQGRSTATGMECRFTPDAAGEYRITGMVRDSQNRLHETQDSLYAQGRQAVLWEDTPDFSLDLRADKRRYRQGETAQIFIKNPYPGAQALVTVERYGVIDHWVQKLDGSTPVVRVPVKPEYIPGAYVSVTVMSPRVSAAVKDGVDLGKPSLRMGYTQLTVDDPYREIEVTAKPARAAYKPGERVQVELRAQPRHPGSAGPEPVELAVAVLDEAVFDLIQGGTVYFDPLKGFTSLESLDLTNYSLLTRLVGRQKFEKKGANSGGDGGADLALRSVEKFVAYWNPSLKADAQGRAQFEFTLPDNLTGWRVLALAVTPSDRMGLGQGTLTVSKATELRPAMPNQLSLGDRFDAGFTVLNREKTARTLDVQLAVTGGAQGQRSETVTLQSFERRTLYLPVKVTGEAALQFTASAGDAADRDALAHSVPVKPPPLTQAAADVSSVEAGNRLEQVLEVPAGSLRGEVRVSVAPTVIGNLDGAFDYMRAYPYLCWEQQLSRAVMAAHFIKLRDRLDQAQDWPEAADLPKTVLADAAAFQAPGGGMTFWLPQDQYQSPYLSAFTALAFGWLRELGYTPPQAVSDKLDAYLQTLLKDDITIRGYESAEARAQVRAVVLAALAQQQRLKLGDLQRYAPQLPRMGLFGQALFLQAAAKVPGAGQLAGDALNQVLARGQQSAGRLSLQDDRDSAWGWLLGSELRSNCAALSGLLAQGAADASLDELPMKLTRAITQARGAKVHWQNTQENLFCTRALIEYADRYEQVPVALRASVALDDKAIGSVEIAKQRTASLSQKLAPEQAGKRQTLTVAASGSGRAYVSTVLRYTPAVQSDAVNAGLAISRRYSVHRDGQWQPLQAGDDQPLTVRRGERIKVDLEVAVPAWMNYVVIDDPVPGGLEPINPDLATASAEDAAVLDLSGGGYPYPFYHRELRFEAVRHFADWLPQGRYQLSWIGQAVATGEFAVDAPRAEQMYDPDVYGLGMPQRLRVEEAAP